MNDKMKRPSSQRETEKNEETPRKQPYEAPQLIVHGKLTEVTEDIFSDSSPLPP